jgi:hypothetical protein
MWNIQANCTASVANIAAVAVLSLGFVAAGTYSAFADNKLTVQSVVQSGPSVRSWHRKEFDKTYLVTPGSTRQVDTDWVCKTATECADYHGSNGG